MSDWGRFMKQGLQPGIESDCRRPLGAESIEQGYALIQDGVGLVDRSYRKVLIATGEDREAWLHNLTTNHVKSLAVGDGNYAFSLDIKGRILFDMNILMREKALWIDLDACFLDQAQAHLSKYIIMEDVTLVDGADDFVRIGLTGGGLKSWLTSNHPGPLANIPLLGCQVLTVGDAEIDVVRTDFCGAFGLDLYVPQNQAVTVWKQLAKDIPGQGDTPVSDDAVQIHRIEAGIAWSGCEITEEYVPAETGQSGRAVAVNKGCYLGQEVVERMRSRDVVARRLMSLDMSGDTWPSVGDHVCNSDGNVVGKVTSACRSLATNQPLALAYVKSSATTDTAMTIKTSTMTWPVTNATIVTC